MFKSTFIVSTLFVTAAAHSHFTFAQTNPAKKEAAKIETMLIIGHGADEGYTQPETSASTKSDLAIGDSAVSVQTVSLGLLQDQQATSLNDALRHVSGVEPMFYLGGSYERFVVRGFTQSLATYRNGVLQPFSRFHLANTASVEVLKGPSALEYGMSDPGGIINVITRRPAAEAEYSLEQTASSLDEYRTSLGATGALGNDALTYRVDASYLRDTGFRDATDTQEFFIAPSLAWQISADTRIDLSTELERADRVYDQGIPALGKGFLDVPIERNFGQENLQDNYDNALVELNIQHQFNQDWQLKAGYSHIKTDTFYRSVYAYANLQPGRTEADRYAWFGPEHLVTDSVWAQFNGKFSTGSVKHHVVMGVQSFALDVDARASETYIDTIDVYQFNHTQSRIDGAAIEAIPQDQFIALQDDQSQGFFIQDNAYLTEQLILSLGLRVDEVERKLHAAYYSDLKPFADKPSETSPRAGLLYKFSSDVSAYINYAQSFGPAFNYEPSELYDPETAEQYEAGMKIQLADKRAWLTASVFELTKQNIPTPSPTDRNKTVAIGEATSKGLELDFIGQLTPGVSLTANYAYTTTDITRDFSGNKGKALPNAPEHQGGAWLRYSFQQAWTGLSLGGGFTHSGQRFGDAANSYGDGAYTQWDMFASYDFKWGAGDAVAQINWSNITDETHYTMRARWTNMPSPPMAVVASLNVKL